MRLIDADELKAKVEAMVEHKVQESDYDYSRNQTLDYVADILIEDAPTIYAEPVKHGEWELEMDWNIPAWRCSECGFVTNYIREEADSLGNNPMNLAGSNFCPNCGARMIGGEDE